MYTIYHCLCWQLSCIRKLSVISGNWHMLHHFSLSQKYWLTRLERHTACLSYPIMNNLNPLQRQDINQSFFSLKMKLTIHPLNDKTSSLEAIRPFICKVKYIEKDLLDHRYWCQSGKIETSVLWLISLSLFMRKSFYCQRFFSNLVPTPEFTTSLSRL